MITKEDTYAFSYLARGAKAFTPFFAKKKKTALFRIQCTNTERNMECEGGKIEHSWFAVLHLVWHTRNARNPVREVIVLLKASAGPFICASRGQGLNS